MEQHNILVNEELLFHGIGLNVLKFISIMDSNIYSENGALQAGIKLNRNFTDVFSKKDYISVALSPTIGEHHPSWDLFIKDGISFVIQGIDPYIAKKGSGMRSDLPDEGFVKDCISHDNIIGVMVPKAILKKRLDQYSILNLPARSKSKICNSIKDICFNTIDTLKTKYHYQGETDYINNLFAKRAQLKKRPNMTITEAQKLQSKRVANMEQIDKFMTKHIYRAMCQHFGKNNLTLDDILSNYNINIYNTANGKKIRAKQSINKKEPQLAQELTI